MVEEQLATETLPQKEIKEHHEKIILFLDDEDDNLTRYYRFRKLQEGIEVEHEAGRATVGRLVQDIYYQLSRKSKKMFSNSTITQMHINGQSIPLLSLSAFIPSHTHLFKLVVSSDNENQFDSVRQEYICYRDNINWPYINNIRGMDMFNGQPVGRGHGNGFGEDRLLDNSPENCLLLCDETQCVAINKWCLLDAWKQDLENKVPLRNPLNKNGKVPHHVLDDIVVDCVDEDERDICGVYDIRDGKIY